MVVIVLYAELLYINVIFVKVNNLFINYYKGVVIPLDRKRLYYE